MKKTQEQFTVVCEGLFLNNEKPAEWKQAFPWEPSVGFHFMALDDSGEPTGEVQKKYLKKMWFFQAMGGKNAQGKYFRLEAEHGEIPAKEGKPAKPYITITPLAEVFSDGTARFFEAPKDEKVNVPASSDKPKGPVTPPAIKTQANGPVVPKPPGSKAPANPQNVEPNTKKAMGFFSDLSTSQSDAWWTMKTQIGYDGADACNVLEAAWHMTQFEISRYEYKDEPDETLRQDALKVMDFWTTAMRTRLLAMKFSNIRERLSHHITLCASVESLDKVLYKAWVELPESDFLSLRSEGLDRIKVIQSQTEDGVFKGKIIGTLQPEMTDGQDFFAPDEPENTKPAGDEGINEHGPEPKPAGPTLDEIAFTVRGINNITDWKKLRDYWATTKDALKAVEEVKQAMRLWVADQFMRAKYQANVDGMIAKLGEMGLMTAELESTLNLRYSELSAF